MELNYTGKVDADVCSEEYLEFVGSYSGNSAYLSKDYFTKYGDYSFDSKKSLEDYYDKAIGIGTNNVMAILADECVAGINLQVQRMQDYVGRAANAKIKIEAAIEQDRLARQSAAEAYDEIIHTCHVYGTWVTKKSTFLGITVEHQEFVEDLAARQAAAEAKYEEVWNANCWKPGGH